MEYTVKQLADMSGVSTRTLHYYDQIHLLTPKRMQYNDYRIYTEEEVDRLQQILFFRELSFSLEEIKEILDSPEFDKETALEEHLIALRQRQAQTELLIRNVRATLLSLKGDITMEDAKKFEGLKEAAIKENETKYGTEIRSRYGEEVINDSNEKLRGMSKNQWEKTQEIEKEIAQLLKSAVPMQNTQSEEGKRLFELHKEWLCAHWPDGLYNKEMHRNMAEMYLADERFTAYYEEIIKGGAQYLHDVIYTYTE